MTNLGLTIPKGDALAPNTIEAAEELDERERSRKYRRRAVALTGRGFSGVWRGAGLRMVWTALRCPPAAQ